MEIHVNFHVQKCGRHTWKNQKICQINLQVLAIVIKLTCNLHGVNNLD